MNPGVKACITLLALSLPVCVHAAAGDELADIRRQMETLQEQYENRLKELEIRLEQAEALARQNQSALSVASSAAPVAAAENPAVVSSATAGVSNAFNPALSVTLQGSVNSYSENRTTTPCRASSWARKAGSLPRGSPWTKPRSRPPPVWTRIFMARRPSALRIKPVVVPRSASKRPSSIP